MLRTAIAVFFTGFIFIQSTVTAQNQLLKAGPMLGYVEMQEANLWIQTTEPAEVSIRYWIKGKRNSAIRKVMGLTQPDESYTKQIKLTGLEYGTEYAYEIYLDGNKVARPYPLEFKTQELWQWRKDPPSFTVAFGSCLYTNDKPYDRPGDPYGTSPEILESIADKNPDMMLWLGDNVYFREPDFYSVSRMDYRYKDSRDTPQMQRLLSTAVNLAVWDDHDYGPNNADRTYRMREESLEIFKRYWANPGYGTKETDGVFTRYLYNDVEFFLLDDRYHRAPNRLSNPTKPFLGKEQMQWLKEALVNSEATFKIIVSGNQMTNRAKGYESLPAYLKEYNQLMSFLAIHEIEGVLFLTGDVHYSQLLKTEREGLYPIYEFTSSPLTAGVYEIAENEHNYENPQHVKGTLVTDYNFGMIKVTGSQENRTITLESYDRDGKMNWRRQITQQELSVPEE